MAKFEDPVTDTPFTTRATELKKDNTLTGKSTKWTDEENAMMTVTGAISWSSRQGVVLVPNVTCITCCFSGCALNRQMNCYPPVQLLFREGDTCCVVAASVRAVQRGSCGTTRRATPRMQCRSLVQLIYMPFPLPTPPPITGADHALTGSVCEISLSVVSS